MEYPALPRPEGPGENESTVGYGLRLLSFVVSTGVTGTLTEEQLLSADHAYPAALGRETLAIAVDRFTSARHQILAALRQRISERKETAEAFESVYPKSEPITPSHLVKVQPRIPRLPDGGVALPFQVAELQDAF